MKINFDVQLANLTHTYKSIKSDLRYFTSDIITHIIHFTICYKINNRFIASYKTPFDY